MRETGFSQFTLERYLAGDTTQAETRKIEETASRDTGLAAAIEGMIRSNEDILNRYPAGMMAPRIAALAKNGGTEHTSGENQDTKSRRTGSRDPRSRRNRQNPRNRPPVADGSRGRLAVIGPVIAAVAGIAAVVVFCIALPVFRTSANTASFIDRIKGKSGVELRVYLKPEARTAAAELGQQEMPLANDATVREGSTVQLAYSTGGTDEYGVIFSIDGRGAVTLHYPYTTDQGNKLSSGTALLEEAYTLDDAPDFEAFFFVSSKSPLDTGEVLKTAKNLSQDPKTAPEKVAAAFKGLEVKQVILKKGIGNGE
jgi:hypothetical protein